MPHAAKVLTAFGLGYGRLQEEVTAEQQQFIDQAVQGLAEDRHVICVRLALFAEMVKDKLGRRQCSSKSAGQRAWA